MLSSISIERQQPALAVYSGKIFVMGGFADNICHNSVECYDPLTNGWTSVASMNEGRSVAHACESEGYLYVVGGGNGTEIFSSIERYDPLRNTWTMV